MKKVAKKPAKKPAKKAAKNTAKKPAPKAAKRVAKKPAPKAAAKPVRKPPAPKAVAPAAKAPVGPPGAAAGFHTVTPYMICKPGADAIEFYKKAFGAIEVMRMPAPNGLLGHAELKIGDSPLMLADEWPGQYNKSPQTLGGGTQSVFLYVADVDALMAQAVKAGATVSQPASNMFWGDRFGKLRDPFGHEWAVATHIEDVTPEEMGRRMREAMKNMPPPPAEPEPEPEPPEAA